MNANVEDDNEKIEKIKREVIKLTGAKLKVGFYGEKDAKLMMIVNVHEYGVSIEVTEAMQGWFMAHGFAPPQGTIEIPERSFVRSAFDENKKKMRRYVDGMVKRLMNGRMSADELMNRLGEWCVSLIRQKIDEIDSPPLSPVTLQLREHGGDQPLQDRGGAGGIWSKVSYEVEW